MKQSFDIGPQQSRNLPKRWREGARRFAEFWSCVTQKNELSTEEIGSLQALFLGEKPAVWNNKAAQKYRAFLEKYGIRSRKYWVYDPQQIDVLRVRYPSLFQGKTFNDLFVQKLDDVRMGILLGTPWQSVQRFAFFQNILGLQGSRRKLSQLIMKESTKKQESISGLMKRLLKHAQALRLSSCEQQFLERWCDDVYMVNVYGVTWIDIGFIKQSLNKQERLQRALKDTGLIKLVRADFDAEDLREYVYDVRKCR